MSIININNKRIYITESDSEEDDEYCENPLCDHKESDKKTKFDIISVNDIDDLIFLGKQYHCKQNRLYNGINLRILCNLVQPLTKLKGLIGMKKVKENIVNQIVFFLQGFNQKEKCNNCVECVYGLPCLINSNDDMLHTKITGPPGVGKTELGKILGQIYKGMGILSKGHMHIAKRSDLIDKYLGHTALKTQKFIDKCNGGVMFIDEVYSLGNPEGRDSFSKECIDTINQNLTENRNFLCIIAGYEDALDKCFFAYNEGLKRRFTFHYNIEEYTSDELMEIFVLKVHNEDWKIDTNGLSSFFRANKEEFPYFGGDIETFFLNCKIVHARRVLLKEESIKRTLILDDLENGLEKFKSHRQKKHKGDNQYIQSMYI